MVRFITKKISNKIIFSLFILMTISSLTILFLTTKSVEEDSLIATKNNLEMLNTAVFQSLRHAMNSGDPKVIEDAEEEARDIKGVKSLIIAKSQPLIDMYSPGEKTSTNKDILNSFKTKKEKIIEINTSDTHALRMIKPMIAKAECLMCHANQSEGDVIGIMDLTFSLEQSDNRISAMAKYILIMSTILGWLTIFLVFIIVKKATSNISTLKQGFNDLLNSDDKDIKLHVDSKDEVGEVADLFNEYMDKVRAGLKQDEAVIEEANDVLEKTGNGFFVYNVEAKANNPYVEDLKNKLNTMIIRTKDTLDKINVTLREYSESKFDYKINDRGIYGDLGSLAAGIKLVGNNTSEILAMIMNTGDSLNHNTKTLSNAAADLSASSNKQAASLEETAAALEQITANIQGNTQSAMKMAKLAKDVTASANTGEELANQTAKSMDDINEKVSSINEAIEVIDQIAFQTNILSLNAAVEAATAGEAGKGFAVVAQEVRNLASRSAEAAKEIKDIVEIATQKAHQGKDISGKMIKGYLDLNQNISETIQMIEQVEIASKEQETGILQINDAVTLLDQATQKNASVAEDISSMSAEISSISTSLVTAASRASFLEEARDTVCNVELVYDTAKLKVDILVLKDNAYSKLGSFQNVSLENKDVLDKWLNNYMRENPDASYDSLETLQGLSKSLQEKLDTLIQNNANKDSNDILNQNAKAVEIESLRIFGALNHLKKDVCKK